MSFESNESIIYDIKYIKSLNSLNSLYFVINNLDVYIKKSSENKYLIFASTDKNGKLLGNYMELWDESKEQVELVSGNKVTKYKKDL